MSQSIKYLDTLLQVHQVDTLQWLNADEQEPGSGCRNARLVAGERVKTKSKTNGHGEAFCEVRCERRCVVVLRQVPMF